MIVLPKGKAYRKHHLALAPYVLDKILTLPDGTTYYDKRKFVLELNDVLRVNAVEIVSIKSLSRFIQNNASSWFLNYGLKGYCFILNSVTRGDLRENLRTEDYIL
jgi:hypothetical protein